MARTAENELKYERVYRALTDMLVNGEEREVEGVKVVYRVEGKNFRSFDIPGTPFVGSKRLSQYEAAEYITSRPAQS